MWSTLVDLAVLTCVTLLFGAAFAVAIYQILAQEKNNPAKQSLLRIQNWVKTQNFTLDQCSFCHFWRGPFFHNSPAQRRIYRITITTPEGKQLRAYVRITDTPTGVVLSKLDLIWDHQPGKIHTYL
jgi:predicted small secreted protein